MSSVSLRRSIRAIPRGCKVKSCLSSCFITRSECSLKLLWSEGSSSLYRVAEEPVEEVYSRHVDDYPYFALCLNAVIRFYVASPSHSHLNLQTIPSASSRVISPSCWVSRTVCNWQWDCGWTGRRRMINENLLCLIKVHGVDGEVVRWWENFVANINEIYTQRRECGVLLVDGPWNGLGNVSGTKFRGRC